MDKDKKFYLLAEISGWNCSQYIGDYALKLQKSEAYRILSYNIPETETFYTKKAKEIVSDYKNLSFEPKSIKECFILEEKINYLALFSHPEFYINPLAISTNYVGEISSIGDLIVLFKGKYMTINQIIIEDETPLDEKKIELEKLVDEYYFEAQDLVNESILGAKSQTNEGRADHNWWLKRYLSTFIYDSIIAILLFFFMVFPNNIYLNRSYDYTINNLFIYVEFLFPSVSLIKILFDIIFYSYHAKLYEPINYARRFLKKNSSLIYQDIRKSRDSLVDYLFGALTSRIQLIKDITDFSILSLSYIDLEKVVNISNEIKKTRYQKLLAINTSFFFLSLGVTIFSFVIYILSITFNAGF